MAEIVKVCNKHGELTVHQVSIEKTNRKKGFFYRCSLCRKEKNDKWRSENLDKHRQNAREWREKVKDDPEYRRKHSEWAKQDRKNNPEKYREQRRLRRRTKDSKPRQNELSKRFNIDINRYHEIYQEQESKCRICKKEETRASRTKGEISRLAVDHCHKTNIIRGLLCSKCNVGLGSFMDDPQLLKEAAKYLETAKDLRNKE